MAAQDGEAKAKVGSVGDDFSVSVSICFNNIL